MSGGAGSAGAGAGYMDRRDEQYARLLVETCLDVQPGWQVLVACGAPGRPLFEEVCKVVAERGAYVLPRLTFNSGSPVAPLPWIQHASDELLGTLSPLEEHVFLNVDALVAIVAPENTRDASAVEQRRLQ